MYKAANFKRTFLVKRYHIDYMGQVIYNISVEVILIRILGLCVS